MIVDYFERIDFCLFCIYRIYKLMNVEVPSVLKWLKYCNVGYIFKSNECYIKLKILV